MAKEPASPGDEAAIEAIRAQHSFMGHPKGIGTLSIMQLCNSFANYSMTSILVYYLYLEVANGGLGFAKDEAAQLVSLYSAVLLLCGLVGSYVADRILGPRTGLRCTRILAACGYIVLALPLGVPGFAVAMVLLWGSAAMGGRSLEALMGKLYAKGDERRDGAFTLVYVIQNIGAAAPAIAGTIALVAGYHVAFGFAAVLAVIGVLTYVLTEKKFFASLGVAPDDPIPAASRTATIGKLVGAAVVIIAIVGGLLGTGTITIKQFATGVSTAAIFIPIVYLAYIINSKKTTREEAGHVIALIPLFICNCFSMLVWTQSTSILAIYAETTVDRNLFGLEITPAAFQTVPAIAAVIWGAVLTGLWTKLGRRQPTTAAKVGIGTVLWGLGPVFMVIPFLLFPAGVKVSPMWLIVFYLIIILGEAFNSATGYSAATIVAPAAFATQMVTVWSLSQSTGAALSTIAVNFYHEGSEVPYFLVMGGITIVIGLAVAIMGKKLNEKMGIKEQA